MRKSHLLSTIRIIALAVLFNSAYTATVLSEENTHFHGYGELHYGNTNKDGATNTMDNHRLVLGWTHRYNNWIRLNVEVDYEHAAKEMELEFAFIDFLISDAFNVRAGSLLMPVGYLNEYHEPPLFYSVERPYVQKNVIPTTWQEGGAGIFGSLKHDINYRLYVVNGLDGSKFKASSGIRSGRHKGGDAPADDLAVVGRLEYDGLKGARLGFSGYRGNAGQGTDGLGDTSVTLIEADVRYRVNDLELTGLYSKIMIGDTEELLAANNQLVGESIAGFYVEAAYHIGKRFLPDGMDLVVFGRHEQFNTQDKVASGQTADPQNDIALSTIGLSYFPIPKVAVKADLEMWKPDAGDSWEQFNLGLAYMY